MAKIQQVMKMLQEQGGREEAKLKQGESILSMFSKLLSANSCTHSDLEEVMTKLDELAKEKKHPNAKVCLKGLEELGGKK